MTTDSIVVSKPLVPVGGEGGCAPASIMYMIDHLYNIAGGGEQALFRTIRHLPRDRFLPSVVTFSVKPRSVEILRDLQCPLYLFPMQRTYDWNGLSVALRVQQLFRLQKPSIVHTFFETSNTWGGLITKLSFGPLLVSSRRDMGILRSTKHRIAYSLINKLSDGVQVVSERIRRVCIESEKISPQKVFTVHNGIEMDNIDRAKVSGALEQRLGFARASHVITTVASIRRVKGLDTFLRAAAIVRHEFPSVLFVIAGWRNEPFYFEQLQRLVNDLGITENVVFLDELDEVFSLLKLSDVFCLLSLSEGFSNALLEAMASRLPCVATNVGGNPEAIEDGRNGFLVPPKDPESAAQRIIWLLRNPELAARMGCAARKTVEERFTSEIMIGELVCLYDHVLRASRSYSP